MSDPIIYTHVCFKCGKEKLVCDFITRRGKASRTCLDCDKKIRLSKKKVNAGEKKGGWSKLHFRINDPKY